MPIYCPPPTPEEIYHHGILGQKWGKRNGPPYPLGASDHSASERKAGWRKSIKDSSGNTHYESRMTKRANKNVARARKNESEDKVKERELNSAAKEYEKAAKTASSSRKAKRLNKMADSAREDANLYKESSKEWKEIGDYQKKKAKASAAFDSKMQKDVMQRRTTNCKKICDHLLYSSLHGQKYAAMARTGGMTEGEYVIRGMLTGGQYYYAQRARRKAIKMR